MALCFVALRCVLLYCVVFCCIVFCFVVLCCVMLYCVVFHCVVLRCVLLHCVLLYCVALSSRSWLCVSPAGNPPVVRFWQEDSSPQNPLKPHKASAQTVETTVYVLLTALLRGQVSYIKPILTWITQDQRYGGGFYSTQVGSQSESSTRQQ